MTELKPCPFCGGEAEAVHEINGFWTVECVKCGALVDGIEEWNKRAERTCHAIDKGDCLDGSDCPAWECSECGGLFEVYANYCSNCGAKVVDE